MNEKERQIISELRKKGNASLNFISHKVGMPISTVYDKISRMHQENLVQKYSPLLDFSKLGYFHHAYLAIKVEKPQRQELSLFLRKHASVNSLNEIDGGFDFMIETLHKDVKEYRDFLEGLKENFRIIWIQEHQIISVLEKEKFC